MSNQDILVKLIFPPTSAIISKTILIHYNQKVSEVIQYASQLAALQGGYSLYLPHSKQANRGQWLDDNTLLSNYSISSSDNILVKRRPGFKVRKNTLTSLKGFKEGKVQKLSSYTKIWNPRYLRLYSQRLVHTSNENDSNSDFISFADIINVDRDNNRKYSFNIEYYLPISSTTQVSSTTTSTSTATREIKIYTFRCTNQNEMEEWVNSIRTMLKKSRPDLFLPPLSILPNNNNNIVNTINNNNNNNNNNQLLPPSSSTTTANNNNNQLLPPQSPGGERSKSRSFSFSLSKKKKEDTLMDGSSVTGKGVIQMEEENKQIRINLERETKIKKELERKYMKLKKKYSAIKKKNNSIPILSSSSSSSNTSSSSLTTSITNILTRSRSMSTPASPELARKIANEDTIEENKLNNNNPTNNNNNKLNNPNISSNNTPITPYNGFHTPKSGGNWTPATSPFAIGSTRIKSMLRGDRRSVDSSADTPSTTETETFSVMDDDDDLKLDEIKELKDQLARIKDKLHSQVIKSDELERDKKQIEKEVYTQKKADEKKEREQNNDILTQNVNLESMAEVASRMKQALLLLKSSLEENIIDDEEDQDYIDNDDDDETKQGEEVEDQHYVQRRVDDADDEDTSSHMEIN